MRDAKEGKKMSASNINDTVVLSKAVNNNNQNETRFVAIMEARRVSDDVTYHLDWHRDSLNPQGNATVQFSRVPETPGGYQIGAFVISDLGKPKVLTEVSTSNIAITDKQK